MWMEEGWIVKGVEEKEWCKEKLLIMPERVEIDPVKRIKGFDPKEVKEDSQVKAIRKVLDARYIKAENAKRIRRDMRKYGVSREKMRRIQIEDAMKFKQCKEAPTKITSFAIRMTVGRGWVRSQWDGVEEWEKSCIWCGKCETVRHALAKCVWNDNAVRKIKKYEKKAQRPIIKKHNNTEPWINRKTNKVNVENITLAWAIWKIRKKFEFDEEAVSKDIIRIWRGIRREFLWNATRDIRMRMLGAIETDKTIEQWI